MSVLSYSFSRVDTSRPSFRYPSSELATCALFARLDLRFMLYIPTRPFRKNADLQGRTCGYLPTPYQSSNKISWSVTSMKVREHCALKICSCCYSTGLRIMCASIRGDCSLPRPVLRQLPYRASSHRKNMAFQL